MAFEQHACSVAAQQDDRHPLTGAGKTSTRGRPRTTTSIRAQCERYLRHAGRPCSSVELGAHVGEQPTVVIVSLRPAVKEGTVRRTGAGRGGLRFEWVSQEASRPSFSIDWPPGFVSQWDRVGRQA